MARPISNEPGQTVNVFLPGDMAAKVLALSHARSKEAGKQISRSTIIQIALAQYLEKLDETGTSKAA